VSWECKTKQQAWNVKRIHLAAQNDYFEVINHLDDGQPTRNNQLSSNFILVQLRVNNSRPRWFLFSTASTSVIDTRIAKELGLPVQGKESSTATGRSIGAD